MAKQGNQTKGKAKKNVKTDKQPRMEEDREFEMLQQSTPPDDAITLTQSKEATWTQPINKETSSVENSILEPLRHEINSSRLEIIHKVEGIQEELTKVKTEQERQHIRLKRTEQKQAVLEDKVKETEIAVLNLERYSRNFNLVFFGFQENNREQCKEVIQHFIKETLKIEEELHIEIAHRLGRVNLGKDNPRPIIAKFLYREEKTRIQTAARNLLQRSKQYVIDDLCKADLATKRRLAPIMKSAWKEGVKVVFHNGKLFLNGKEYVELPE